MSFVSKVKGLGLLAIGAAGGVAVTYFLDPDRGRARRAQTTDQLGAKVRSTARQARKQADYAAGRAVGVVAEGLPTESPPGEDQTLKAKVESEVLGHVDGVSPGEIVVTARDGVVELRGQVPTRDTSEELVGRTRRVTGVRDVVNLLHLPGEPAPNVASAREASQQAAEASEDRGTTRSFG